MIILQQQDMKRFITNKTITFTPNDPENNTGKHATRMPENIYHFHPNHLGTGTLITDVTGEVYQFFLNLPYGETMIEQGGYDYDNPYKFNGKELDQETGLYYYGARYGACPERSRGDPETSIFLSVDPLAEKYPSINPYVYTMANPINLVDPTGMEAECCPDEYDGGTLDTVYISTKSSGTNDTWGSGAWGEYDYYSSFAQWKSDFGYPSNMSYVDAYASWERNHKDEWEAWVHADRIRVKQENLRQHLQVWLTFFYEGGDAMLAYAGMGGGGLAGTTFRTTPALFTGTTKIVGKGSNAILRNSFLRYGGDTGVFPKFISSAQREFLINNYTFTTKRGAEYWLRPGHLKMSHEDISFVIRNGNYRFVPRNGGAHFFEYIGKNKFGYGYSRYQLSISRYGEIFHSTLYSY